MVLLYVACVSDPTVVNPPREVGLTWYQSDPDESWEVARAGLDWALSQVGATPPEDGSAIDVVLQEDGRLKLRLSFEALAVPPAAEAVLAELAVEIDANPGSGDDDLGRFLLRGLHEPWRYYALTAACTELGEWEARRPLLPLEYAVTTSLLLASERLIRLPAAQVDLGDVVFLGVEGTGSLVDGSFSPTAYETVDVMDNGQFRYAVYDGSGALQPAGETNETGMPAKCAWCHEASVHAGTPENDSAPGYLDYAEWKEHRDAAQAEVDAVRAALATAIPYDTPAAHGDAERLVEGFLYPDAARVAREWDTTAAAVERTLGVGRLTVPEFGWTGRYAREEVDAAAPRPGALPTLRSARDRESGTDFAEAPAPGCR